METTRIKIPAFLQGGGEMGVLTREYPWSETVLGNPDTWPQTLRTTVNIVLNSKFPMFLFWGEELTCFYNDAYRPSLGNDGKHPWALGKPAEEVWPEIWHIIKPLIDQVLTTGTATWSENQLIPIFRNNKIEDVYWTFSYSPVYGESNKPIAVLVTCEETTVKVNNILELEQAHKRFKDLVLQAPMPIAVFKGKDLIAEIANNAYLPLVDKTAEEFLNKPLFESIPEAREFIEPIVQQVFNGQTFIGREYPLTFHRNGKLEQCYFDFVYEPVWEGKVVTGFMAVAHEVTTLVENWKKVEQNEALLQEKVNERTEDLKKQKDLLDNILENSSNGISVSKMIRNENGKVIDAKTILANEAAIKFTGLPKDIYLGKSAVEIDPNLIGSPYYDVCINTLKTGNPSLIQYFLEPTARWLELTVSKMDNEHLIHIFTDVTQIKESQLQLEKTVDDLKKSNQNLEDFAYAASHDLKEPVRKVNYFTERLKNKLIDRINEEEKGYFQRLEVAAERMNVLIDDLLTYSQLSVKPKNFEPVNLTQLVQLVVTDLDYEIELKSAVVKIHHLPTISGQYRQLHQLFHNLIGNALKYSKENIPPAIEVSCETIKGRDLQLQLSPDELNKTFSMIAVKDNGIGFESKDAERIFNIFTRLHGNTEYKGSGIGLSIVKKVMENHNGYVIAESEPGRGSNFKLYFPGHQLTEN